MLRLPERDVETKARHTVTIVTIMHRFITVTYFFSIFYYTFSLALYYIERCERFSPTFIVKSLKLSI